MMGLRISLLIYNDFIVQNFYNFTEFIRLHTLLPMYFRQLPEW